MKILEEMSWPEIEEGLKGSRTVILPVGAAEEHGPHLPIFTDTAEAVAVAREAARRSGVFVAPTIPYGICRSTRGFPGTVSVTHEALKLLVHDVILGLFETGFENIMVLTGHAGGQHLSALKEACLAAVAEREMRVSLVSLFDLFDMEAVEAPNDGHAGELETSLMMVIRNDLVKGSPGESRPTRPRFLVLRDLRPLMGNGIMGDPTRASAQKGEAFLEMGVSGVLAAIDEMENYPPKPRD